MTSRFLTLPFVSSANNVALYMPHENEISTLPLIHFFQDKGCAVFLPVMSDGALTFYSYQSTDMLQKKSFGIYEPKTASTTVCSLDVMDVMCIPLVAFDDQCCRLGRGGGFYDKALSQMNATAASKPYLVGLGYEFQRVESLPTDPWDVPLDFVITEKMVYNKTSS